MIAATTTLPDKIEHVLGNVMGNRSLAIRIGTQNGLSVSREVHQDVVFVGGQGGPDKSEKLHEIFPTNLTVSILRRTKITTYETGGTVFTPTEKAAVAPD